MAETKRTSAAARSMRDPSDMQTCRAMAYLCTIIIGLRQKIIDLKQMPEDLWSTSEWIRHVQPELNEPWTPEGDYLALSLSTMPYGLADTCHSI